MPDLWGYFKSLFNQSRHSSPSQPLLHELIVRSAEERQDYAQWKETLVCRRLKDWLHDQYTAFLLSGSCPDESIDFLDTPSSKGFVIHFYKTRYSNRDVAHFFDYLKERVLALEYKSQISDIRSYERPNWAETVQRHYLKPRPLPLPEQEKLRQRFGNVTIEYVSRDDKAHQLLFRATAYSDHLFQDAERFEGLMKELLV
ncbi:MAG: hypothetical protein IPN74_13255 [Haliscomenobacter sp.]|nr:hypothetical protein [Haliscomenobacter sp.]